jgi:hypothetical protein
MSSGSSDEDAAFECVVCLKDVRTSAGAIWQCPEGHMFCCVCFERIGGAASPCPSCRMLLGSIRCRALEKQRDHHLRRATEAPGAAARNAQPPVNGQATQTTKTVVTPVMSIQEQVLLLSERQHKGEDVWLGERAERERSGGEEQAAAAARQSSRQEQKTKMEASCATVQAHDKIMEAQQGEHARRARAVEERKRRTAAIEEERRAKAAAAAEAEQRRGTVCPPPANAGKNAVAAWDRKEREREREREKEDDARAGGGRGGEREEAAAREKERKERERENAQKERGRESARKREAAALAKELRPGGVQSQRQREEAKRKEEQV